MTKNAVGIYRMWHNNRAPDGSYSVAVKYPDAMTCIGHAVEIMYWSDKFQKRGKYELFTHECDSGAEVYEERSSGEVVQIGELVGGDDFKGNARKRIETADLAFMDELTFERMDGKIQTVEFDVDVEPWGNSKTLFKMNDAEAVILAPDVETLCVVRARNKPMIVKGAKMRITAGGIRH